MSGYEYPDIYVSIINVKYLCVMKILLMLDVAPTKCIVTFITVSNDHIRATIKSKINI